MSSFLSERFLNKGLPLGRTFSAPAELPSNQKLVNPLDRNTITNRLETLSKIKEDYKIRKKTPELFFDLVEQKNLYAFNEIKKNLEAIEFNDDGSVVVKDNPDNEVTIGGVINDTIYLYEFIYDSIEYAVKEVVPKGSEYFYGTLLENLKWVKDYFDLNDTKKIEFFNAWHKDHWKEVGNYIDVLNSGTYEGLSFADKVAEMPSLVMTPKQKEIIAEAKKLRNNGIASQPPPYSGGKTRRKKRTKKRKTKTKKRTKKRKKRKTKKRKKRKTNKKRKRKTNKKKR